MSAAIRNTSDTTDRSARHGSTPEVSSGTGAELAQLAELGSQAKQGKESTDKFLRVKEEK